MDTCWRGARVAEVGRSESARYLPSSAETCGICAADVHVKWFILSLLMDSPALVVVVYLMEAVQARSDESTTV